jgi:hypothetical protein
MYLFVDDRQTYLKYLLELCNIEKKYNLVLNKTKESHYCKSKLSYWINQ